MGLILLTAPAAQPVTTDEVWEHLRLTLVEDDSVSPPEPAAPLDESLVDGLIETATAWLDGGDGKLGRALITQEWKLTLDYAFPAVIEVPLPPLQQVDELAYVDGDGAVQTLTEGTDFDVFGVGGHGKAEIAPAYGKSWPSTRYVREAVRLSFTAGYGDAATDVPAPIRQALKLLIGHLYEHPEQVITGTVPREIPLGLTDMIGSYRLWT